MEFPTDERAQAIQIGAVLLFGILILFLSLYQAVVVPDQNEEIEFNHNEDLQQQLTELRSTVILMPGSTSTRAASLDLGVRYPSRAIFVNPGPASGTLRTVGTENSRVNVTITNASAVDDAGETRDFWNGTALSFETGAIEYRPGYNLYQGAPRTVYEHSVLYNAFERENVTQAVAGQTLVEGSRITVIALDGSLTENRVDTLSLDVDPISTRTRVVELNGTAEPVTLRMPTGMSEDEWNKTFEDELVPNGHVQDVSVSPGGPGGLGLLEVTLEAGERYQLELAKVGVGTGATGTDAEYLTDVAGNGTTLEPGDTTQLTVEARDRFNGPESGVTVTADPSGGTFTGGDAEKVTDTEGQATYEYEAGSAGTHRINFTIDQGYDPDASHEAGSPTNVTMQVTVQPPPSDGGSGGSAYNVSWQDPSAGEPAVTYDPAADRYDYNASQTSALELTMGTDPVADGARVEYAASNRSVGTLSRTVGTTDSAGRNSTTFDPKSNGTVNVYTWSGGSGDAIEIEVIEYQPGGFQVAVDDFDDPVTEGKDVNVTVTVENTGSETETQTIDLNVDNDQDGSFAIDADEETVTLDPGKSQSVTLTCKTQDGDAPAIDFEVLSDDDRVVETVTVNEPPSGLTGTGVTDIVPNASEQMQTFTFTISGEDLPSGETVVVDLDEPQATSPIKVDYSSASVRGDASINTNSGTGTLNYTASSGDVPAGTTVRIRVTSINAGDKSDQSDPYAIPISRTDFGVEDSTRFSVTPQNGTAELEDFEVTDLVGTDTQEQTIRFTPTTEMEATGNGPEILTVDLSKAQDDTVDYSSASEKTTSTGSAGVNTNSNVAYLKFEADGGVTAGTEVNITIESVNPSSTGETYETGFSRGAADTNSTTFDVQEPPFFEVREFQAPDSAPRGTTITVNATVENTGDLQDTQTIEYRFDGTAEATQTVTLNPGEATTVEFSYSIPDDQAIGTYTHGIFSENDSATATIDVEESMADRTYVPDIAVDTTNDGNIEFGLRNTGGDLVEISAVAVNASTDPQATTVDNDGNREFAGAGGYVNIVGGITIGASDATPLNQTATISAGTLELFSLEQFRKSNGKSTNHNKDDITVTLVFSDGSTLTFTATAL